MSKASPIYVIGVDGTGPSNQGRKALERAQVVFGASRFGRYVPSTAQFRTITPIKEMIEYIGGPGAREPVAILASGDPLFFGIGSKLMDILPKHRLFFFPALTSVQELCAKTKIVWSDLTFISLHGRGKNIETLLPGKIRHDGTIKAAFLTGPGSGPAEIARACINIGIDKGSVTVGENLGMDTESVFTISLPEAVKRSNFAPLNCVILNAKAPARPSGMFGRREDAYSHQGGLITKREVRAAVLAALELPSKGVLWDIGAGSGSVSVEASGLRPGLKIFAIEKEDARLRDIKKNRLTHCALGVEAIKGIAPQALGPLPDPQRIFIGGGGKNLGPIMDVCLARLKGKGPIVATAICLETLNDMLEHFRQALLEVDVCRISISRMTQLGSGHFFKPENPVYLVKAVKK